MDIVYWRVDGCGGVQYCSQSVIADVASILQFVSWLS